MAKAPFATWEANGVSYLRFADMASGEETSTVECRGAKKVIVSSPYIGTAATAATQFIIYQMTPTRLPVLNAAWTQSTRTITAAGAFTKYTNTVGVGVLDDYLLIEGGANVKPGRYRVSSKVGPNAITLGIGIDISLSAEDLPSGVLGWLECWSAVPMTPNTAGLYQDYRQGTITIGPSSTVSDASIIEKPTAPLRFSHVDATLVCDIQFEIIW